MALKKVPPKNKTRTFKKLHSYFIVIFSAPRCLPMSVSRFCLHVCPLSVTAFFLHCYFSFSVSLLFRLNFPSASRCREEGPRWAHTTQHALQSAEDTWGQILCKTVAALSQGPQICHFIKIYHFSSRKSNRVDSQYVVSLSK